MTEREPTSEIIPHENVATERNENNVVVEDNVGSTSGEASESINANTLVIGFRILDSVWRICWLELAILSFLTLVIAAPILRSSSSDTTGELISMQLKEAFDKALFLYLPVRLIVALALLLFSRFSSNQRTLSRSFAGIENLLTLVSVVLTYISTIYLRSRGFWEEEKRTGNDPEFFAKKVVGSALSASGGRLNGLESVQADVGLTVVIAVGFVLMFVIAQLISCAPCLFLLRLIRSRRAD